MPKFLISRLSALGDTVCSLPVAVALKQKWPNSHITWVVDARFSGVVERCSAIDKVVRAKPGLSPATWPHYAQSFDAAIDLQGLLKSALCIARAKAKRKVGYHWQREGSKLFSEAILPDPSSFHVVDQYVDVARALGAEVDLAQFGLAPLVEDALSIRSKVGLAGPYVVINAGAGWATKRWPPESFGMVIDKLAKAGIPSVLVGGRGESDRMAADLVRLAVRETPIDLLGQTTIPELIALIAGAAAHVGGDTGTTHIAAALGVPAFGLYSITNPRRSCPYGQFDRCFYNPDGLSKIAPQPVIEAILEAVK